MFVNGQDITDAPMEFPPGQTVSGMQIVLTKKISALLGQVTDAKRQSGARRHGGGVPGRREAVDLPVAIHQGGAAGSGRPVSSHRASRPSSYLVVALQGLEDGQAGDPEFLATVKDLATKTRSGEGETKAVDVKLRSAKSNG